MGDQENQKGDSRGMEEVLKNVGSVTRAEVNCSFKTMDRKFYEYLAELGGLAATLDYIRDLKTSNIVVDVGTGRGIGWSQIEKMDGDGLEFWATGLVDYDCKDKFDGRFRKTPAEVMEGFENNSVGGIIAVYSVEYGSPVQCIDRFDEILVPGGVLKACFTLSSYFEDGYEVKSHHTFTEHLQKLGYDVAVSSNDCTILAIKPGGLQKASDLMEKDLSVSIGDFGKHYL